MKNNKPIPKKELKQGMRVKIPWNGHWWGSNKKYKWFKGSIIKINDDSIKISLRKSKGLHYFCCGDNLNYIYKQL